MEQKSQNKIDIKTVSIIVIVTILLAELSFFVLYMVAKRNVIEKVTLEAGNPITADLFFKDYNPEQDKIVSDISTIDTTIPNTYKLMVSITGVEYESVIEIADTVAPTAQAVPQNLIYPDKVKAEDCVTNIEDVSPYNIEFKEEPDFEEVNSREVTVLITDIYGNKSEIQVPLTITKDTIAPKIEGAHDLSFTMDEKIIYRDGITVTDNTDSNPELKIDTSEVDVTKEGIYPVTYIASDKFGNTSRVTVSINIIKKPNGVNNKKIYSMAQKVLKRIITDDMSDTEKAFRIFNWLWHNVKYVGFHTEMTWQKAAYDGFKKHSGNCFTFYSMAKVMLDIEEIPNMMVSRYPIKKNPHYWNLVYLEGEWYHCDSNPYRDLNCYYFMRTDEELDSRRQFDSKNKKYPARATESVQSRLDFKKMTVSPE